MMATKNMGLSPAASALGLGDMLGNQVDAELDARRKKLLGAAQPGAAVGIDQSTQAAFSPMSLGLIAQGGQ